MESVGTDTQQTDHSLTENIWVFYGNAHRHFLFTEKKFEKEKERGNENLENRSRVGGHKHHAFSCACDFMPNYFASLINTITIYLILKELDSNSYSHLHTNISDL